MLYLSLGTNIGHREANLTRAIELLNEAKIEVTRQSSVYETAPRDVLNQPWFLNMVLECRTTLFPLQLLGKILRIEKSMGRDRGPSSVRRGPRLIDIDVLLFHNAVINTNRLTVPHPRMFERRFVLEPLLELVPGLRDPLSNKPLSDFLKKVLDQQISKLQCPLRAP
jgi:2-amino-4-hydroxy-6-hydroxymethyldihydropteridine diphosphokinase